MRKFFYFKILLLFFYCYYYLLFFKFIYNKFYHFYFYLSDRNLQQSAFKFLYFNQKLVLEKRKNFLL